MNLIKYIFVDLDETLLHTDILYGKKHSEVVPKENQRLMTKWQYPYLATIRPGAKELLALLRSISPGNVFILTTSTRDYANGFNELFDLGFKPSEIYSREHLQYQTLEPLDPKHFPNAKVYLIDDRSAHEQYEKINFLSPITGDGNNWGEYVWVSAFHGYADQGFTPQELDRITKLIEA